MLAFGLGTAAPLLALGAFSSTVLRWFGRHSYEVYLTHEFLVVPACALFIRLRRGPVALWVIAIVLCSAALGGLVARFFSEPLNRRLRVTG